VVLLAVTVIHLASLGQYMREPEKTSILRGRATVDACILQCVCALALFIWYSSTRKRSHFLELCSLLFTVCDSFRTHTLWRLSSEDRFGLDSSLAIPQLQTAATILYGLLFAIASWSPRLLDHNAQKRPGIVSRESNTCLLSLLFLVWLNPLLSYALKYKVTQKDLAASEIHPNAVYSAPPDATTAPPEATDSQRTLLRELVQQLPLKIHLLYFGSGALDILAAAIALCQPLIIRGLVDYLGGDYHSSAGAWLVLALFLE
jgi:hypothetical protein